MGETKRRWQRGIKPIAPVIQGYRLKTGGMMRKVMEAKKISSMGTDVYFVNGNKPDRITAAARGGKFPCTKFGGKKR